MSFTRPGLKQLVPELLSLKGCPYTQTWKNPAAPGNTDIHAAIALPAAGTTDVTTAITQPDVPRVVRLKGNAASVPGGTVITGLNQFGEAATDTIAGAPAGGTQDGAVAFSKVTKITVPTQGAGGDTISVGYGAALGTERRLGAISMAAPVQGSVYTTASGERTAAREAAAPTLDPANDTILFNTTALAATKTYTAWYWHADIAHA